jgi:hypothetical protein
MHPERDVDARLRDLFEAGDPAADGREPTRQEAAALRREMLRRARTSPPLRWLPLAAAATAAALGAALLLPGRMPRRPAAGAPEITAATAAPRQIRFATAQGTQIIWVLDPNLDL